MSAAKRERLKVAANANEIIFFIIPPYDKNLPNKI